ncbi:hypothetical protein [Baekduia sp.]|uniref:hypothetical protein n=1 Tax=Baekduia sp. TaxID=2600305 RepID=UPI002D769D59|nr:hypothetical protein [Baekduia sp.]
MKVVGTGAPVALTLRLRERELRGLSDELEHRRRVVDEAMETAIDQGRGFVSERDDGRTSAEIVLAIVAMQDLITRAVPNAESRFVITGPTWLLGPAIRGASIDATERLVDALRKFADSGRSAEGLRDAVGDASAWSETLIGLDHAENFGLKA